MQKQILKHGKTLQGEQGVGHASGTYLFGGNYLRSRIILSAELNNQLTWSTPSARIPKQSEQPESH